MHVRSRLTDPVVANPSATNESVPSVCAWHDDDTRTDIVDELPVLDSACLRCNAFHVFLHELETCLAPFCDSLSRCIICPSGRDGFSAFRYFCTNERGEGIKEGSESVDAVITLTLTVTMTVHSKDRSLTS